MRKILIISWFAFCIALLALVGAFYWRSVVSYYNYWRLLSLAQKSEAEATLLSDDIRLTLCRFFYFDETKDGENMYDRAMRPFSGPCNPPIVYDSIDNNAKLGRLLTLVERAQNSELKTWAMWYVACIRTDEAFESLLRIYKEEQIPKYKHAALNCLRNHDRKEVINLVINELTKNADDYDPRELFFLCQFLSKKGSKDAVLPIIKVIESKRISEFGMKICLVDYAKELTEKSFKDKEAWQAFCRKNNLTPDILERLKKDINDELTRPSKKAPAPEQ